MIPTELNNILASFCIIIVVTATEINKGCRMLPPAVFFEEVQLPANEAPNKKRICPTLKSRILLNLKDLHSHIICFKLKQCVII